MTRAAASPHVAIPRVARLLKGISVEKLDGGSYLIRIPGDDLAPRERNAWQTLAFLSDLAAFRGVDLEPVRFTGAPPARGLSAWEESAIRYASSAPRRQK